MEELRLRIEPIYDGEGTVVTNYNVIDQNNTIWFTGSHGDCYYYIHPDYDDSRFKVEDDD
jgi:hypothetical protein